MGEKYLSTSHSHRPLGCKRYFLM